MAERQPPIARIRLARSWPRLLAVPGLLLLAAAVIAIGALVLVDGPLQYVVGALGLVPAAAGVYLGLRAATMELDVEEAALRLRWMGGDRAYALVPGPVTRVRLRGEEASALRARSGMLGLQLGPGTLRDEEPIEVARLAPTRTAILVPTDRGRLAIAAASEPALLDALSRAARARDRIQAAEPALAPEPVEGGEADVERPVDDSPLERAEPPPLEIETPPHILTGIERAMLEERLARERLEAEAADDQTALPEEAPDVEPQAIAGAGPRDGLPAVEVAAVEIAAAEEPEAGADVAAAPERRLPVVPSIGFVLLPLLATLGVWGAAAVLGRLPVPDTNDARLTALALALAGPATSVAAMMARTWWPRLVGVVVTSGLAATVFVGRAVFGA